MSSAQGKLPRNLAAQPRTLLALILFLSANGPLGATTCVKAGELFDGTAFLGPKTIVVEESLIAGILDTGDALPEDAAVIDATRQTLLPGFIDSHIHFMAAPLPYVDSIEARGWGRLAAEGISLFPGNRFHLLQNGITGVIDMGGPPATYAMLRKKMAEGRITGPELYFPGPLFTAPGGHPAGTTYVGQHDLIDNGTFQTADAEHARDEVRLLAARRVDFIKVVYDRMWYRAHGVPRLSLDAATAVVMQAHALGLRVFAHVGSEEEARDMVGAGVDGIEHAFASTSDSLFDEMASRTIVFTPTVSAYTHYAPQAVAPMMRTIARARRRGVTIVAGTDYPAPYGAHCGDDIFVEMKMLEGAGLSRIEVLQAVTRNGAEKLGRQNETGAIAPGRRANLVFYDGSIEEGELASPNIRCVMLHGNLVFQNGVVAERARPGLRRRTAMVFPYGYWDDLNLFSAGVSVTGFDVLESGASVAGDLSWSIRNMWGANVTFSIASPIPKTTLSAAFHFDNLNRMYYGLGNNTVAGDGVEYALLVFTESVAATTSPLKYVKVMSTLAFDQRAVSDYGGKDLPTVEGSEGGHQSVAGIRVALDTRDHVNNPWTGVFVSVGGDVSHRSIGSTNDFRRLEFDARGFISPIHRNIIAARLLYRQAFGDVPFDYLPTYGGPLVGRGFVASRFMDYVCLASQLEYRFPIWKILSGVAFVDAGQVRQDLRHFTVNGIHVAAGFGPRLSFGSNENSILGLDAGFSSEGWVLQFHAGQVF